METRKAEPEGWRILDTSGVVLVQRMVSGDQRFEGETGLAGSAEQRNHGVSGVVFGQRVASGDNAQ